MKYCKFWFHLQEAKMKKRLKVKLEMAKFLQQTLDSMALQAKGHRSQSAKEFVKFFEKASRIFQVAYILNSIIL